MSATRKHLREHLQKTEPGAAGRASTRAVPLADGLRCLNEDRSYRLGYGHGPVVATPLRADMSPVRSLSDRCAGHGPLKHGVMSCSIAPATSPITTQKRSGAPARPI